MPRLTITEAARLCRKHRSTIQRAIAGGRLTRGNDLRIDTADLVRVGYLLPGHEEDPIPAPPLTASERQRLQAIERRMGGLETSQCNIYSCLVRIEALITQIATRATTHHDARQEQAETTKNSDRAP